MTKEDLVAALKSTLDVSLPLPAAGETALRHRRLMDVGRQDLAVARLAEAHWDAIAVLAEAGRPPKPGALYGVWASENASQPLRLNQANGLLTVSGIKAFCSGAGLIDRTLLTVRVPDELLIDVNLRENVPTVRFDYSTWKTPALLETQTATATFSATPVLAEDIVGGCGWYLSRPGFWHGACGPAACWAGGAAGLLDYALQQSRDDPHTLAHLGAMQASVWAMQSYLDSAGREIDANPLNSLAARVRALTLRHLVEQACTDTIRRLVRAYGPHPIVMNEAISRRYYDLDLYLRQSHAERDIEVLGRHLLLLSKHLQ